MTTIVYKDGIMAADTRAYRGNRGWIGTKTKIFNYDGLLIGASSAAVGVTKQVVDWYIDGCKDGILREVSFQLLVVKPNGSVMYMDDNALPSYLDNKYFAIGSGEEFALGALAMGASAKEAVKVASQFDPYTSGKITELKH